MDETSVTTSLLSEIHTMQFIADRTTIPVPKVFDCDLDPANSVGFPYVIMEAIKGRPLGVSYSQIPPQFLKSFLTQFANYIVQLRSLSFPAIGSLEYDVSTGVAQIITSPDLRSNYTSSLEFMQNVRDKENEQLKKEEITKTSLEDRELACWILTRAVLSAVEKDFISGPFPLCHPDLHYSNILVDQHFNITGIIDWSGAATVPQELFASIPGFRYPAAPNPQSFEHCLRLFRHLLKDCETKSVDCNTWISLSEYVGSDRSECVFKGLTTGMPWRGVAYARYLLPLVFGPDITWERARGIFEAEEKH